MSGGAQETVQAERILALDFSVPVHGKQQQRELGGGQAGPVDRPAGRTLRATRGGSQGTS